MSRRLAVRLTPRSSQNRIEIEGDAARAWVTASPTDGQANAALIRLVADTLDVAPPRVNIVRGHTSRAKTLDIKDAPAQDAKGKG